MGAGVVMVSRLPEKKISVSFSDSIFEAPLSNPSIQLLQMALSTTIENSWITFHRFILSDFL